MTASSAERVVMFTKPSHQKILLAHCHSLVMAKPYVGGQLTQAQKRIAESVVSSLDEAMDVAPRSYL